jgi:hypothetical protein
MFDVDNTDSNTLGEWITSEPKHIRIANIKKGVLKISAFSVHLGYTPNHKTGDALIYF